LNDLNGTRGKSKLGIIVAAFVIVELLAVLGVFA